MFPRTDRLNPVTRHPHAPLLRPHGRRKNHPPHPVDPDVVVDRFVAAAPEAVWDLLVDTTRWPEWGPSVAAVELDHDGSRIHAGSTGRVRTAVGVWVPFRITGFDDGRRWSWLVAGIPATSHTVDPAPGGCRVGFGLPLLAAPYALVCRAALERIDRLTR